MIPRATVDFESRSACSLRASGAWRYSRDPTTEILCLGFRLPYWEKGQTSLWHPAFPAINLPESDNWSDVVELVEWIQEGGLLEAHNAWFEQCLWENILVVQYCFPFVNSEQWRCSAAKAAAHALPRNLVDAGLALNLAVSKDMEGHKTMMKVSKPRKSRKKEREHWEKTGEVPPSLLWHESCLLFETLFAYCRQDVLAEEALSNALDDLSPQETQIYLLDQTINRRGFQLDRNAVRTALHLIQVETSRLNRELARLTGGVVQKATQRAQMLQWFKTEGLLLDDTQKGTLDSVLGGGEIPSWMGHLTKKARRGLEIVRTLGRSSTAKYQAMANWADPQDWRVRGGLVYHGATTGRWSGAGVQPHNFPKGTIKDQTALWTGLISVPPICPPNRNRMELLSEGLRGAIVAPSGRTLYVADYAAIEARVVLWLAGDEDALDIFRRHEDIYLEMASAIYGKLCHKEDKDERALGKIAVLGLGYQMGASKFVDTCAVFGITIDEEFARQVVETYRSRFSAVKELWWDTEDAAIQAVRKPGHDVHQGHVIWRKEGRFLFCVLPSGRRLSYPDPLVKPRNTPWGEVKASLTFMGVDSYSRKWKRQTTYGGMLVENITQAVSRDLMAEAMLRCAASGIYDVVLTVHDEIVAETDLLAGNVQEFEQLVSTCPSWAEGLPVAAEGWKGIRYRK